MNTTTPVTVTVTTNQDVPPWLNRPAVRAYK